MPCDEQCIALIIRVHMCGTGDQSTSNTHAKVEEATQHKREREKARWAAMTQEERDEKIKNVGKHISLEKQKLPSLVGREVTPWSSYNQAIIYIDIYIYIYMCVCVCVV